MAARRAPPARSRRIPAAGEPVGRRRTSATCSMVAAETGDVARAPFRDAYAVRRAGDNRAGRDVFVSAPVFTPMPLRAATLTAHARRMTDDEPSAEARDLIRLLSDVDRDRSCARNRGGASKNALQQRPVNREGPFRPPADFADYQCHFGEFTRLSGLGPLGPRPYTREFPPQCAWRTLLASAFGSTTAGDVAGPTHTNPI